MRMDKTYLLNSDRLIEVEKKGLKTMIEKITKDKGGFKPRPRLHFYLLICLSIVIVTEASEISMPISLCRIVLNVPDATPDR